MPISAQAGLPTLFVRKQAYENNALMRSEIDARFNLTDNEFNVEGNLIAIGPLPSDEMIAPMIEFLEEKGLVYFEDFFEMSGNWPEWLRVYATAS
jgi:hypothetical protein